MTYYSLKVYSSMPTTRNLYFTKTPCKWADHDVRRDQTSKEPIVLECPEIWWAWQCSAVVLMWPSTERNWLWLRRRSASSSSPPPHNRCDGSHEHLENCQHGSENKLAILRIQNWIISMGNLIKCKILHISFEIKNIQPHYWQNLRFHPWHFDLKIYS